MRSVNLKIQSGKIMQITLVLCQFYCLVLSMSIEISSAGREVLWNIPQPVNSIIMYSLFGLSLVVFFYGIYRRVQIWNAGTKANLGRSSISDRFRHLLSYAYLRKGVNREKTPALFHSLILWGFLVLLFTTTMVAFHEYIYPIYKGSFYLAVTILSDFFGFFLLLGLWLAYQRRFIAKPDRLNSSPADTIMLGALALMVVQGYFLEGMRISATSDQWAWYSPLGLVFSLPFNYLPVSLTKLSHFMMWWFHTVTVFAFIGSLPYTKFFHIISSSLNIYYTNLDRPNGALSSPGDIEKIMEEALSASDDADFIIGSPTIKDLTWKERLDLDACTGCGRCQSVCPAYAADKPLSPKWLILDLRDHMLATDRPVTSNKLFSILNKVDSFLLNKLTLSYRFNNSKFNSSRSFNKEVQSTAKAVGVDINAKLAGEVLDEKVFWSCTSCRACEEVCPVGISHLDIIGDVRRSLALMDAAIPSEAQASLRAIETRGNPFGPAESRADWANGLSVKILSAGEEVDVLYWVGCVSAFDKRKQSIARSMVQIMNTANVNWGMLGNRECCTGDPARRLGEENLFQTSVKTNLGTIRSVKFKRIVANCPHCFHSLKNEYPDFGNLSDAAFEIIHHTQFIQELIDLKKIEISKTDAEKITFHDPCYLGRYNKVYDEPRETLVHLGKKNVEMSDNKEKSKCCGAGGGHYWFDMKQGQRINVQRVLQAKETSANTIATGCPFCMQMLEDGVKITENEGNLRVKDIAELVAESLVL